MTGWLYSISLDRRRVVAPPNPFPLGQDTGRGGDEPAAGGAVPESTIGDGHTVKWHRYLSERGC